MKSNNIYKKIVVVILAITIVGSNFANIFVNTAHAAINREINYQGKLTNASNVAVADGTYNMTFKLYTTLTGGTAIWTETLTTTNKVPVTNGIFSVMLGSTTPFTGIDFNQTLYLGVTIESDSEMTPRKIIGAVPAAFVADTVDGISSEEFLRSDAQNATSSTSTFLNILQTGSGKIAEFFGNVSQSVLSILSNGNVGIGSSTPYAALSVVGASGVVADHFTSTSTQNASVFPYASTTALTIAGRVYTSDATVSNTITLANLNGPLQGVNGLVSASSTISTAFGGTGISTSPSYGNILVGQANGTYTLTATSSLGLAAFAYPFTSSTNFGVNNQATTGITWFQNGLNASSTSHIGSVTFDVAGNVGLGTTSPFAKLSVFGNSYISGFETASYFTATTTTASTFPYASTTALSATTLCLSTDCRTSWPTGGGGAYPFTPTTNFGVNNQATTGIAWFQNGFNASSTSHIASTTFDVIGNVGIGTTSPYGTLTVVGSTNTSGDGVPNVLAVLGGIASNNNGQDITLNSGSSDFTLGSQGGAINILAGQGGGFSPGTGGSVNITAGSGGGIGGTGGNTIINGGAGTIKGNVILASTAGKVGVGTTTPGTILSVAGVANFASTGSTFYSKIFAPFYTATSTTASTFPYASTTALSVSGTGYFDTASTTNLTISSIASGSLLKTTTAGGVIAAVAGVDFATLANVSSAYPFTQSNNFNVNNQATTGIAWFQNGFNASSTSHVGSTTFDISGNVGIGTTSPYAKLSVQGSADQPQLVVQSSGTQTQNVQEWQNSSGVTGLKVTSGFVLTFVNPANISQNFSWTLSGSSIQGSGGGQFNGNLTVPANQSFLFSQNNAGGNLTQVDTGFSRLAAGKVSLGNSTNGDSSGTFITANIGVGTSSPYAPLSVLGQIVGSYFTATTTTASTFPYASTTALSATTLCLSTDCRTSWPTGGGGAYPFTPTTNFNVNNQATTGIAWFQNGFNASSTSHFDYASTSQLTVGQGDSVLMYNASVAQKLGVRLGTSANPDQTPNPAMKVERTLSITDAIATANSISGDGVENYSAIVGITKGVSSTEIQPVGVSGFGLNDSTSNPAGGGSNDALGMYGVGRITGSGTGTGIGAFFLGRRDNDTGRYTGAEIDVANYGTASTTYSSSGFSSSALWMNASGNAESAAGMVISNAFGRQFSVGLAFTGQVTGGYTGGIASSSIRDDSSSNNSILINGTHSNAAIAVAAGSGQVLFGGTSSVFATTNNILEVQGGNVAVDGLAIFGSVANQKDYTIRVRNSAGQVRFGIVGTAGSYFTGTAVGDSIIGPTTSGKMFHIGGSTKVLTVTQDNKLGFFAATPVSQQANTTDLRALLINFGLLASGGATPLDLNGGFLTSAGLLSNASSTIGNGTATGGLTISGGATTTGIAYFASNVGVGTTSPYSLLSVVGQIVGQNFVGYGTATSSLLGNLTIGSSTMAMANSLLSMTDFKNSYVQTNLQNLSAGDNASSAYVVTANNGNDISYYTEFGMNNSGYRQNAFSAQNPGDSFVNASDGALVISTASSTNPLAELRFLTGGTASSSIRMTITNSGNVGIGTTSPYAPLSVLGQIVGSYFTATTTTASTFPYASTTALSATTLCLSTDCRTSWPTGGGGAYPFTPTTNFNVNNQATTGIAWFQNGFNASSTSHIASTTFDISGNVGIGSTTPNAKLGIAAGVTTNNNIIDSTGSINDFLQINIQNTSTGVAAQSGFSATADNGTMTTNFAWMGINNSNFYNPQSYNVGGAGDVEFLGAGNDMYMANNNPTKSIYFLTGGTATTTNTRMTILSGGNIGIGTTTPNWKLSVAGMGFFGDNVISSYFTATSSTATSTFAGGVSIGSGNLVYDSYTGVTSVSAIETGNLNFDTDAGAVSWVDMDITNVSVLNTIESYTASLDANPMLTIFGKSDGHGNLIATSTGVGIGTTTPLAMLDILAGSTTPFSTGYMSNYNAVSITNQATSSFANVIKSGLNIVSTGTWNGTTASNIGLYVSSVTGGTSNYDAIFNGGGNVGIASTTPGSLLTVSGSAYLGSGTASTLTIHSGLINYPIAATTTIKSILNAYSIATTTSAALGVNSVFNLSFDSTGATSTVGFFVSTSTGLTAGRGTPLQSALKNLMIVGNGKVQAGIAVVNGGICVDSDGWCSASTTGRVTARSLVTSGSDVAENYPSNELLEAGDIVSTLEHGFITLAQKTDEAKILGVVSTAPGLILGSGPDDATDPGTRYPIALAGRVPVKISLENGEIAVGDSLALSDTLAGTAMKAKLNSKVIGIALDKYDTSSVGGTVLMFVSNNAKTDTHAQVAESLSQYVSFATSTKESSFKNSVTVTGTLTADTLIATNIQSPALDFINTQITGIASTTKTLEDRIKVLEATSTLKLSDLLNASTSLTFSSTVVFNGGLKVNSISSINDIIDIASDVNIIGRPYWNQDTAGFAFIKKESKKVEVVFSREYAEQPIVTETMSFNEGDSEIEQELIFVNNIQSMVTKKSTKGFTITLNKPAPYDIKFSWIALAVKNAKTSVSSGEVLDNQTINPVVSPAIIIQTTSTSTPLPPPPITTSTTTDMGTTTPTDIVVSPSPVATPSPSPTTSPEATPDPTPTPTPTNELPPPPPPVASPDPAPVTPPAPTP